MNSRCMCRSYVYAEFVDLCAFVCVVYAEFAEFFFFFFGGGKVSLSIQKLFPF